MTAQYCDQFQVLNGPEDGTIFPITRAPFDIGGNNQCAVAVRMDDAVPDLAAHASAASEGYRIRRADQGELRVNGRSAGFIRSRIIQHGDVLHIGNTQLVLLCATGGLASRSQGLAMQSDGVWAIRWAGRGILSSLKGAWNVLHGMLPRRFPLVGVLFLIAVAVGALRPNIANRILGTVSRAFQWLIDM
jgi:hypothetical protein